MTHRFDVRVPVHCRYSRINGICAKATPGFTGTVAEPSVMAYLNSTEGMLNATVNYVESESAAASAATATTKSRGGRGGATFKGGARGTTRVVEGGGGGGGRGGGGATTSRSFSATSGRSPSKYNQTQRVASPAKGSYTSYLANSPQRTSTPPRSRGSRMPADKGGGAVDDLTFDASHVGISHLDHHHDHHHDHDHDRTMQQSHMSHSHLQPHSQVHRSHSHNRTKLGSTVSGWQNSTRKGGTRGGGGKGNRTFLHAADATHMTVSFRSEVDVGKKNELEALANLDMTSRATRLEATMHEQAPLGSRRWVEPPYRPDAEIEMAKDADGVGSIPHD